MGGKETDVPDLNLPIGDSSSSNPPIQLHNFVPLPSLASDDNQDDYDGDSGFMPFVRETMQQFWNERLAEISNASDPGRQLAVPLARVKRMMKSDDKVEMVSAEAPILLAKSMELFVMELTFRALLQARKDNRWILHGRDVTNATRQEEFLALFLSNIIDVHDPKEEEAGFPEESEPQLAGPRNLHDLNQAFHDENPDVANFSSPSQSVPSDQGPGSE